jgi:pyruvate formate lyase activating enzyme
MSRSASLVFGGWEPLSLVDYPGYLSLVAFTQGCQWRCHYCHNPELHPVVSRRQFSADFMLERIRERLVLIEGVVITGGEPTLQGERLIAFLRALRQLPVKIKLDTNGDRPTLLARILREKLVDYVAMDVKAATLAQYEALTNRPIVWRRLERSVSLVKMMPGHQFRITTDSSLHSSEDLDAIRGWLGPQETLVIQQRRLVNK